MDLFPQTFVPLGNMVVLQVPQVDKSKGGVVLPDSVVDKQMQAPVQDAIASLVVSAGPLCRFVKRGDWIVALPERPLLAVPPSGPAPDDHVRGPDRRGRGQPGRHQAGLPDQGLGDPGDGSNQRRGGNAKEDAGRTEESSAPPRCTVTRPCAS